MLRTILDHPAQPNDDSFASTLLQRGLQPVYHEHKTNQCPGCGRTQWYVGRISAECCFCATALPLSDASVRRNARHTSDNRPIFFQSGRG